MNGSRSGSAGDTSANSSDRASANQGALPSTAGDFPLLALIGGLCLLGSAFLKVVRQTDTSDGYEREDQFNSGVFMRKNEFQRIVFLALVALALVVVLPNLTGALMAVQSGSTGQSSGSTSGSGSGVGSNPGAQPGSGTYSNSGVGQSGSSGSGMGQSGSSGGSMIGGSSTGSVDNGSSTGSTGSSLGSSSSQGGSSTGGGMGSDMGSSSGQSGLSQSSQSGNMNQAGSDTSRAGGRPIGSMIVSFIAGLIVGGLIFRARPARRDRDDFRRAA